MRKLAVIFAALVVFTASADDFEDIASRYVELFGTKEEPRAGAVTPDAGGLFPDIDYASQTQSHWQPGTRHFSRLRQYVARYLRTRSADDLELVHRVFLGWVRKDPVCPNWWWNDIGVPQQTGWCALALGAELKDEERDYAVKVAARRELGALTGQNRTWLAQMRLVRGLLRRDAAEVEAAVGIISDEVRMAPDGAEGIQPDWCFHQHGHQPQFGNYGLAFLVLQARMVNLLSGTRFAYPRQKLDVLGSLARNGYQWIIWKDRMDVSALARQLYPHEARTKAAAVNTALGLLGNSGWERKSDPLGFRYFDRSAYAVWRTDGWMASVRASTPSVVGVETWINEDNAKGMCMADGALFVYSTGREYEDVFPLWDDWRMIPGVTGYLGKPLTRKDSRNEADDISGSSSPTGGVLELTFRREGLSVHKKWTFDAGGVLCEGSGIRAEDAGYEVATCVEHALADRPAKLMEAPDRSVFRNGAFTYTVYAPPAAIRFSTDERSGDFKDHMMAEVSKIVRGKVFSLRILHGRCPADAAYRYRIDR